MRTDEKPRLIARILKHPGSLNRYSSLSISACNVYGFEVPMWVVEMGRECSHLIKVRLFIRSVLAEHVPLEDLAEILSVESACRFLQRRLHLLYYSLELKFHRKL